MVIIADKPGKHHGNVINPAFMNGHVEGIKASSLEEATAKEGWSIPGIGK